MTSQFDKFTDRARGVLVLSEEEARGFGRREIGAEHILLALIAEGDGVAWRVLGDLGVSLAAARAQVEELGGATTEPEVGASRLTPDAKRAIELAVDEARQLRHHYVGTEHLLLGICRLEDGPSAELRRRIEVGYERVRSQVIATLISPPAHEPPQELSAALDRLSEAARSVIEMGANEARRFKHNHVGTEHLLLALVRQQDPVATGALMRHGATLPKIRSAVEFIIGRGEEEVVGEPRLTPRAQRVIVLAAAAADRERAERIEPKDLLVGLIEEGSGIGAGVLESLGVRLSSLRGHLAERGAGDVAMPAEPEPQVVEEAPTTIVGAQTTKGGLTRQDEVVLQLAGHGFTNGEIAAMLGLTTGTVEKVMTNVYGTLAVDPRIIELIERLLGRAARAADRGGDNAADLTDTDART